MTAPRTLLHYSGGALMTHGWYISADEAKRACSEISQWVSLGPDLFRSEDGRWLILDEGPRNKALAQRDAQAFRERYK
jgi:hypothetical protein